MRLTYHEPLRLSAEKPKRAVKYCSQCGQPVRPPKRRAQSPEFPEPFLPPDAGDRDIIR